VAGKAVRSGIDWYAAMIVVARDSPYTNLADLNEKMVLTQTLLQLLVTFILYICSNEVGITPGESIAAGSHDAVIKRSITGKPILGQLS